MTNIIRAYEAKIDDVIPGERSVVSKINTAAVDRYRTVIQPQGGDLDGYRKNPVVLWEHGKDPQRGTMPIGRNQWIKADSQQIIAKTVFRNDEYSQMLFDAYQDGGLRGWSVNILPSEASPPTKDEMRAAPSAMAECQMVYRRWELAEYSGVSVPGNADTLTMIASRGIYVPEQPFYGQRHRETGSSSTGVCEPGTCIACDENRAEQRTSRYIAELEGVWTIHEVSGEPIAAFPNQALAERCLAAMANPVAWTDIHDRMAAEQTARNLDVMGDVKAMLELALLGKV